MFACSSEDTNYPLPPCQPDDAQGGVVLNIGAGSCPAITSYGATPTHAPIGGTILLTSTTIDFDDNAFTLSWEAPSGMVATPGNAATAYVCTAPGTITVTLRVSDGRCGDSAELRVTCDADPGEPGPGPGPDGGPGD